MYRAAQVITCLKCQVVHNIPNKMLSYVSLYWLGGCGLCSFHPVGVILNFFQDIVTIKCMKCVSILVSIKNLLCLTWNQF